MKRFTTAHECGDTNVCTVDDRTARHRIFRQCCSDSVACYSFLLLQDAVKQLVLTNERKTRVCAPDDEVWAEDEYAHA